MFFVTIKSSLIKSFKQRTVLSQKLQLLYLQCLVLSLLSFRSNSVKYLSLAFFAFVFSFLLESLLFFQTVFRKLKVAFMAAFQ